MNDTSERIGSSPAPDDLGAVVATRHWRMLDDGRVQCDLCPRACKLREGARGLCFVRARQNDAIVLTTYGRSAGFCIDPIEKKPLNHFLPGTSVLSFGTAGCNLACNFCQNHDISKSREMDRMGAVAGPETIAVAAAKLGCASIAFTYNDPIIFHEYARDIAAACHERGVKTVAVTAGYLTDAARPDFFADIDAANVDLKAFTEDFYRRLTKSELRPVLDTLEFLVHETRTWVEITNLVIPGENDSDHEFDAMSAWIVDRLGPDVSLHFSAFHPDYRMKEHTNTPPATLARARQIARRNGVRHCYVGNLNDLGRQSSYCHACGERVIGRDWYALSEWRLDGAGHCDACGTALPGVFDGPAGAWGRKRLPVDIAAFG